MVVGAVLRLIEVQKSWKSALRVEVTPTEAAKKTIKAVLGDETDKTKSEHRAIQRMEEYSNSWIKALIQIVSSAAENQYINNLI